MFHRATNVSQQKPASTDVMALARELRTSMSKLRRRMRENANGSELTWSQKCALLRLEQEGSATVTTLAHAEGVRPQSMGATISVLEAAGMVSGKPDPSDRRQTLLSLTPSCQAWIKATRAAREDWLCQVINSELTPDEQEKLTDAAKLLARLAKA